MIRSHILHLSHVSRPSIEALARQERRDAIRRFARWIWAKVGHRPRQPAALLEIDVCGTCGA